MTSPEHYYYQQPGTNMNYYSILAEATDREFERGEIAMVGAGRWGGFENTQELKVLNYKQAMNMLDADKWKIVVKEERDKQST